MANIDYIDWYYGISRINVDETHVPPCCIAYPNIHTLAAITHATADHMTRRPMIWHKIEKEKNREENEEETAAHHPTIKIKQNLCSTTHSQTIGCNNNNQTKKR